MTAMDFEEENDRGRGDGRGQRTGGSRGGSVGARTSSGGGSRRSGAAAAGLSTAALLDIVERFGLVDMVVDRVKARLEEIDVDELIDEVGYYLKRNPEVLVVSLGAITIASGALVFLNKKNERPSREGGSRSNASSQGSRPSQQSSRSQSGGSSKKSGAGARNR